VVGFLHLYSQLLHLGQAQMPCVWPRVVVDIGLWPSHDVDKPTFLTELHDLCLLCPGPWLLAGGFNLIYRVEDKNNDRLNRWRVGQFQRFINEAGLKEIHLLGGLFTWSNEWAHPTLERIDRAFISWEWDELYPASDL
jgi:hypothetical protein